MADERVRTKDGSALVWEPGLRLLAADREGFEFLEDKRRAIAIEASEEYWAEQLAGVPLEARS